MPVTIGGAVRQKKLFVGKQVILADSDVGLECRGKILKIEGDTVTLELFTSHKLDQLLELKRVTMIFMVPEDATYCVKSAVVGCNRETHVLQVVQVEPMVRTEQRSDVRLKTSKLIYLAMRDKGVKIGESWQKASLLDISRGGASILTAMEAKQGDELKVWIPLEEVDHILEAGTRVVRVKEGEDLEATLGLSFEGLSLSDQEKILDYIMKVWEVKKDEVG